MSVKLDIKADIINTRFDKPKHSDVFFVDTNVWYWITYSNASHTAKYSQVSDYMGYVGKIRSVSSKLVRCNLTLAELAHIIEDTEFKIFCNMRGFNPDKYPKKEFRHNFQTERDNVVKEIESSWIQVKQFSNEFPLLIDETATNTFLTDIKTHKLDGYDLFYLNAIRKTGLQLLTDDRDFATVPGITVFTANQSVIEEARTCGKLKFR